jgi:hypothetical protein
MQDILFILNSELTNSLKEDIKELSLWKLLRRLEKNYKAERNLVDQPKKKIALFLNNLLPAKDVEES